MTFRSALLIAAAMAPLVACSGASFRPRAVGQEHVAATDVDLLLDEARAQFRAGNHALAAGSFRRILGRAPDSLEAFNGLAASYDRLGRFDLARRYYEEGLALAPLDPGLRANYAASLRAQGLEREAALADLPVAFAQAEGPAAPEPAAVEPAALTILLPAPEPASVPPGPASLTMRFPPPAPPPAEAPPQPPASRAEVSIVLPPPAPAPARTSQAEATIVLPPPTSAPARTQQASVTIVLPPPTPAPARTQQAAVTIMLPPPTPAPERVPRLERRSLAEVALITRRSAASPPRPARQMAASTPPTGIPLPIRQIREAGGAILRNLPAASPPLRAAPAEQRTAIVELRVLNAVGRRGQAGRMEAHLRGLGWAQISAGDATRRRASSYILASPAQAIEARRLAHQLPFRPWISMTAPSGPIRLVLGNDAVNFDQGLLRGSRGS